MHFVSVRRHFHSLTCSPSYEDYFYFISGLKWSFGVVLWEITTLSEQMCMHAQHQWFIICIRQACLALMMAPTYTCTSTPLPPQVPICTPLSETKHHSPAERIPNGQAMETATRLTCKMTHMYMHTNRYVLANALSLTVPVNH